MFARLLRVSSLSIVTGSPSIDFSFLASQTQSNVRGEQEDHGAGEADPRVVTVIDGVISGRNAINCMDDLLELSMLFMSITLILIHMDTPSHP